MKNCNYLHTNIRNIFVILCEVVFRSKIYVNKMEIWTRNKHKQTLTGK